LYAKILLFKYRDFLIILLSCTEELLFVHLFSQTATEQFRTLKKLGKFLFGKCSKGFDFRREVKGKELVSDAIKNTRDKGIEFFQSIRMTSFIISSAHQHGNISWYHCCSLLLLITYILIMSWLCYLTPVISIR